MHASSEFVGGAVYISQHSLMESLDAEIHGDQHQMVQSRKRKVTDFHRQHEVGSSPQEPQEQQWHHRHRKKRKREHNPLVDLSDFASFFDSPLSHALRFPLSSAALTFASVDMEPSALMHSQTGTMGTDTLDLVLRSDDPHRIGDRSAACAQMLLESKLKIMATRMRYGLDVWNLAAQIVNPYEILPCVALRVLNRAFFKMWELMQTFPLVPSVVQCPRLLSAHLCEGPGGFVQALLAHRLWSAEGRKGFSQSIVGSSPSSVIDYDLGGRKSYSDLWFAITLARPPNVCDEQKMQMMKLQVSTNGSVKGHVHYGADKSGDIMSPENISSFVEYVLQHSNGEKMHLITGDGAFDVSDDFALQEQSHSHLVYSELVTALRLQAPGGSFVLKLFDCFTETTATMIYILTSLYSTVEIVRLRSSRVCNSERFVVAQGFRGLLPGLEARLMNICAVWCKSAHEGSSVAVALSGKLPSTFSEALSVSNAVVVSQEIKGISKAVVVAQILGERLSFICSDTQRKEIVSILRRKLKTIPKLRSNAYSLCETLAIPLADEPSN